MPYKSWTLACRYLQGDKVILWNLGNLTTDSGSGSTNNVNYAAINTATSKNYETVEWNYGTSGWSVVRPLSRSCKFFIKY